MEILKMVRQSNPQCRVQHKADYSIQHCINSFVSKLQGVKGGVYFEILYTCLKNVQEYYAF